MLQGIVTELQTLEEEEAGALTGEDREDPPGLESYISWKVCIYLLCPGSPGEVKLGRMALMVHMKNLAFLFICLFWVVALAGCSSVGGGLLGGVLGAGAAGGGYEYNLKQQKHRVEEEFKAGKIDQKEYEIRKDQIVRDSFLEKLK